MTVKSLSIQKFPIEDLKLIDSLWFNFSNGKYGFRVQAKIWKECGSPTNYTEKAQRTYWDNFGDRVGWRKERIWLYSYFTVNSEIILPFQIFVVGNTRLDGKFWVLFTRIDACLHS